ncbi:MAG TPA: MBG domain-containing protein, partial [Actinomycetota bacterium]|nr:MBG domain-containing protein [Actinomycetota bacterium]
KIAKAKATITVTPYDVTYDGAEHKATGSAKGVNGEDLSGLDLGNTKHTNAGTYIDGWLFSNDNYASDSGSVTDKIAKAKATITVTPYDVTYDGAEHKATGSAKGVNGEDLSGLDLSGTKHTTAGTYSSDNWSFSNQNYLNDSGTVTDKIAKAKATVTVTPYDVTYDGAEHKANGSAKGVNGEDLIGFDLSNTKHTNAGTYTDNWSFSNDNYLSDSGSVVDKIAKAKATVTVTPYDVTYDATEHKATGAAKGVNGEDLVGFDLSNTKHTDAGTYTDNWSFSNDNYLSDGGAVTDKIGKATPTVAIDWSNSTYNGNSNAASASVNGVGNANLGPADALTYYNGTGTGGTQLSGAPKDAGTYTVKADFNGSANYKPASATKTITISKANQTINFLGPADKDYGSPDFQVDATAGSGLPVTFAASGQCTVAKNADGNWMVTLTNTGSCTLTASQGGNNNWNAASPISRTFTINPGVGRVAYIGQTAFFTSGSSSTSAQVTLTASVAAEGGSIANAKVTFKDLLANKVLASGVKVSPVAGSSSPTGTANTVVTLSTGNYGSQSYLIEVKLDTAAGSAYKNCQQLDAASNPCGTATAGSDPWNAAHPTVLVAIPPTSNTLQAGGPISPLAPAGKYANASPVNYSAGMQYTSKGTNPQGQIQLILTRPDGTYYVKSNSISSVAFTPVASTPRTDVTIYTKASIYKVTSAGVVSIDGGVTLRMDAHDGGLSSGDKVGFTVLSSKDSSLYYSNNWVYDNATAGWKTVPQAVTPGGTSVTIG